MPLDVVQTSLSAVKGTLEQLRENAQDVAAASIDDVNANPDLPPVNQVIEASETPAKEFDQRLPSRSLNTERLISALAENVELESAANAQAKTLSTALDILGTTTRIGDNVNIRA